MSAAEDVGVFADLPVKMREARRWLVWRSIPNDDASKKPRKVPFYVSGQRRNGSLDVTADLLQLASFQDALFTMERVGFTGLGFALGPDGTGQCWQGIDLDDLADHAGLGFVAENLPGYTEASPSGKGVHAIGYGRAFTSLGSNTSGIEAYAGGRYFTVTADKAGRGEPVCLADYVEAKLRPLHVRGSVLGSDPGAAGETRRRAEASILGAIELARIVPDLRCALAHLRADDYGLWVRMGLALKPLGDAGRGLWLNWSQTSDKFEPSDAGRWDTFTPNATDYKAVFAEAQRQGWINPARRPPGGPPPKDDLRPDNDPGDRAGSAHTADEAAYADLEPESFDGALPPPRPWAYDRILMFLAVTGVAAPPGANKTTFSFQLGLAYAMDLKFGPWDPVPGGGGKTWIYNGEEPVDELKRRFLAACNEAGVDPSDASKQLFYKSGLDRKLTLVTTDPVTGGAIRSPDVDIIKAWITRKGITLFIIDPLIEFHSVKENDANLIAAVGAVLREIAVDCQCAVLVFHHTPKAANADTSAGDMNAMRGGGPLIGVCRFVYTMFEMSKKDAGDLGQQIAERVNFVRFDDAKANPTMKSAEPTWWRRVGVGLDNADAIRPADVIGALRHWRFEQASEEGLVAKMARQVVEAREALDRLCAEIVRVCCNNGHTSLDKAAPLDGIAKALDPVKTQVSVNTAKDKIVGNVAPERAWGGWRVVVSSRQAGAQTWRKIHVEAIEKAT